MKVNIYLIVNTAHTVTHVIDFEFNGLIAEIALDLNAGIESVLNSLNESKLEKGFTEFRLLGNLSNTSEELTVMDYYAENEETTPRLIILLDTIDVESEEELYKYVFSTYTIDFLKRLYPEVYV